MPAENIIYTVKTCPKCEQLKRFLKSEGVDYREEDMSTPAALTELRVNGVFTRTAPVLQSVDRFLTVEEMFEGERMERALILNTIKGGGA